MSGMIFVNLPVADVAKSRLFYQALGFSINEQFSNENGACVVISDQIFIMILSREY
ncbi:MAG: VOC family protein, partial [Cypionkella sp.]